MNIDGIRQALEADYADRLMVDHDLRNEAAEQQFSGLTDEEIMQAARDAFTEERLFDLGLASQST